MNPSLKLPEPTQELAELSRRLCTRIVSVIDREGAMGFDRYMSMALYEPGLGYYVNGLHKFGADGDFVTAPEHGGLFAAGLAQSIRPDVLGLGMDWILMEVGPGSGALARDLLLQLEHPPFKYLLLEPSASLREVQKETLATLSQDLQQRLEWIDAPPDQPFEGVILGNEVMDALPVARFEVSGERVHELGVTVKDDRLAWHCMPASERLIAAYDQLLPDLPLSLPQGYRGEICLDLAEWLRTVTQPLDRGLALMIDYGYPRAEYYRPERSGGTLVAHYRHRAHFDPFVWPGLTDLSAFVDFTALADAALALGFEVTGFTTQAAFLLGSGAMHHLEDCEDNRHRFKLAGEFKRLVLPGEMGEKFKVMAMSKGVVADTTPFLLSDQRHRL